MSKMVRPKAGVSTTPTTTPPRVRGTPIGKQARARLIAAAAAVPIAPSGIPAPLDERSSRPSARTDPWPFPRGKPDPWPFPSGPLAGTRSSGTDQQYNRDGTLMTLADRAEAAAPASIEPRLSVDDAWQLELAIRAMGRGDHF